MIAYLHERVCLENQKQKMLEVEEQIDNEKGARYMDWGYGRGSCIRI